MIKYYREKTEKEVKMIYPEKLPIYRNAPWEEIEKRWPGKLMVSHLIFNDYSIGMHAHDHYYELNFVLSGQGAHYYEGKRYIVGKGDFFVIPPGFRHGYVSSGDLCVYHIIILENFIKDNERFFTDLPGFFNLFNIKPQMRKAFGLSGFLHLSSENFDSVYRIIEDTAMVSIVPDISVNDILFIHAGTLALIARITQICSDGSPDSPAPARNRAYEEVFTKALEIIESDCSEKLDACSLAEALCVSKSTLYRVFGMFTSQTPKEYIVRKRLEKAKHLIETTEESISGIAVDCGFFDTSHMTHIMMKYMKTTPGKLRKRSPHMQ